VTAAWVVVAVVGLATVGIKAAGPLAVGRKPPGARVRAVLDHLAPALLAALVVTEAIGAPDGVAFDARLAGLGAAAVAVALRTPILLVVVLAAAATAAARALT
jgi:branched-subunit amino acid transport protein